MGNQKGFSLLEVLIVMTIIGILASIIIPELLNAKIRAQIGAVTQDGRSVHTAFKRYHVDWGNYPNSSTAPAFDLDTFDPLKSGGYYNGDFGYLLNGGQADAFDSPDDQGLNQEFWLEMTLKQDPSIRFVIADSDNAPLSGGAYLDGVYVYRNGVLDPQ